MPQDKTISQRCIDATRTRRGKEAGKDGMLTLGLYVGDCLVIDNRIVIQVIDVRVTGKTPSCRRVRVGTLAPSDVEVHRGEVWLGKHGVDIEEATS